MNWDNREEVLAQVTQDGWALRYASDELRNDRKIVMAAMRKHQDALEYASYALKKELKYGLG